MNSHATAQSTKRYADRFRSLAAPGHFREPHGLTLSSLGIGTYLGQPDDKTDGTYAASVIAAVENGLNVIDTAVNYRHNPETQLSEVSRPDFLERVRDAFIYLESAAAAGKIQFYGMATWNGFRQEATARESMQLAEFEQLARDIAGETHHFRFVQIPFNLAMTEALTLGNQTIAGNVKTVMEAANELGITLIASASPFHGQVELNLPAYLPEALGLQCDAERALQSVPCTRATTTALACLAHQRYVSAHAPL